MLSFKERLYDEIISNQNIQAENKMVLVETIYTLNYASLKIVEQTISDSVNADVPFVQLFDEIVSNLGERQFRTGQFNKQRYIRIAHKMYLFCEGCRFVVYADMCKSNYIAAVYMDAEILAALGNCTGNIKSMYILGVLGKLLSKIKIDVNFLKLPANYEILQEFLSESKLAVNIAPIETLCSEIRTYADFSVNSGGPYTCRIDSENTLSLYSVYDVSPIKTIESKGIYKLWLLGEINVREFFGMIINAFYLF